MYVLERVEGDHTRQLLATQDRASVENLLSMIVRSRARSAKGIEQAEHFRAVAYRLATGSKHVEFLTLDAEHFRIRQAATDMRPTKTNKLALRRIVRGLPPLSRILQQPNSVQVAVKTASAESEPEPGSIPTTAEAPVQIHGERFEI